MLYDVIDHGGIWLWYGIFPTIHILCVKTTFSAQNVLISVWFWICFFLWTASWRGWTKNSRFPFSSQFIFDNAFLTLSLFLLLLSSLSILWSNLYNMEPLLKGVISTGDSTFKILVIILSVSVPTSLPLFICIFHGLCLCTSR